MIYFDVNYLAIIVSMVATMAIGFAWYNDKVFGVTWRALVGLHADTPEQKKEMSKKAMRGVASSVVGSLVMAFVLSNVIIWSGASEFIQYFLLGFVLWLGFIAPVVLMNVLYQQKHIKLFLIDAGYQLISIIVISIIIGSW